MKTKLINVAITVCLLLFPSFIFGQTTVRPTMGTTENFVLFTSSGALANTGASQLTLLTGDVSSDTAPIELKSGVEINGSALTKTGDFSTVAITATSSGEEEAHPPEIITQPTDQVANERGSANFTVEASGNNLTYQWRNGTIDLDDDAANISGAKTAILTIDPVTIDDEADNYNVVVTGSVDPPATSDNVSLSVTSTGIDIIDSGNAFTIYPNPFNVSLNIKLNDAPKGNKYELVIYNVLGEVVMKTAITGQITTIETGNIRSGVYLYKVMDNDETIRSGKMIKQK